MLLGLLVFAGVFLVGKRIIDDQPDRWSAQAAVVIFPDDKLDTDLAANYYSTLSQGQVPNTVAEYFRLPGIRNEALDRLARQDPNAGDSEITVEVVEGTSMITITTQASTPQVAEGLADNVLEQGDVEIEKLPVTRGYQLDVASRAEGTAERSSIDRTTFLAVLLLVAAVAAVAAQQVALQLLTAFIGGSSLLRIRQRAQDTPEGPEADEPVPDRDAALLELWGDDQEGATSTRAPRSG